MQNQTSMAEEWALELGRRLPPSVRYAAHVEVQAGNYAIEPWEVSLHALLPNGRRFCRSVKTAVEVPEAIEAFAVTVRDAM